MGLSETYWLKRTVWNVLAETYLLKRTVWNVPSETYWLKRTGWNVLSETYGLKRTGWNVLSETYCLKRTVWKVLSETYCLKRTVQNVLSEIIFFNQCGFYLDLKFLSSFTEKAMKGAVVNRTSHSVNGTSVLVLVLQSTHRGINVNAAIYEGGKAKQPWTLWKSLRNPAETSPSPVENLRTL